MPPDTACCEHRADIFETWVWAMLPYRSIRMTLRRCRRWVWTNFLRCCNRHGVNCNVAFNGDASHSLFCGQTRPAFYETPFLVAEIATLLKKEILRNPIWMPPNTSCRYFWDHPIRLYCLCPRLKAYIHHKFSAHALSELLESVLQLVTEKYGTTLSCLHIIRYSQEYLNCAFLGRWSFLGGPVVWLARISGINASRLFFLKIILLKGICMVWCGNFFY